MKYAKTLGLVAASTLLLSGLTGCGSSDDDTPAKVLTGYYVDSAVNGAEYSTSTGRTGVTDENGTFNFVSGDEVTFKIGDLVLRKQSGLSDGGTLIEDDDAAITFLQSIDDDGNASNGIKLTTEIKEEVKAWVTENSITALAFDTTNTNKIKNMTLLRNKFASAGIQGPVEVTVEEARAHLIKTQNDKATDGTISYIDYKNQIRKAPASAAKAEFHTGTGYGNTLFDSADKKCQNCHNELYDTWKGSMHGNSWIDPIFQSKFQDFLRTHIGKIGNDKTASGSAGMEGIIYTTTQFKGAAQTCIKCHAPGAYYAGDVKVSIEAIKEGGVSTEDLTTAKAMEVNNAMGESVIVAASGFTDTLYKATFQIGHEANLEGINCAFCHSIETPRMMKDGDTYTLKSDLRVGAHGPVKASAGTTLTYDADATNADMNKFFRLWGPEKPANYAATNKGADDVNTRAAKRGDGRYTMHSVNLNNDNNKTHYTGGPFYGPFGMSGKSNENADDDTNRTALKNPHFDKDNNNHFGNNGKSLCLSCHQRSAGAAVPTGEEGAGNFMELCSTQMAVTTGSDTPTNDTASSPKCQKCHMERIEGTLLHTWANPNGRFDATAFEAAVGYALTPELDGDDTSVPAGDNPQRDGWFNSHAFLGASKTGGDKKAAVKKIKSGFAATLDATQAGNTLTVTTTFSNKTAHMFPGAHPMRRALTRVIVTDSTGAMLTPSTMTGDSTFGNITNTLATLEGKTLHSSQSTTVTVANGDNGGSAALDFPGKADDLTGATVPSQRFYSDSGVGTVTISATDATVTNQTVSEGKTTGENWNSAIVDSNATKKFTRIYGHQTGKKYDLDNNASTDKVFVVRPGFDSDTVVNDTRLSPNETETYTLTYDVTGKTGVKATYKVYYMQKGANGKFLEDTNSSSSNYGWLNQTASDAKKLLVTEVSDLNKSI